MMCTDVSFAYHFRQSHLGVSAVLIHNADVEFQSSPDGTIDMSPILGSSANAMSVEVTDCHFGYNKLSFGTISNVGGTLTVYKSLFNDNFAKAGDVAVTNGGNCKVQETCFDSSSSMAPGTIFIESGSMIYVNTNNFGINNSATGSECTAVFQEAVGADCLGELGCDGTCMDFPSNTCPLASYKGEEIVSESPNERTPVVASKFGDEPESSNLTPIIVASLVCALAVLGLIAIIFKRRKETSGGDPRSKKGGPGKMSALMGNCCGAITSPCRKQRMHDTSVYDGLDDNA